MSDKPRLLGLDLVRLAAALLVMLYHLGFSSWVPEASVEGQTVVTGFAYPELLPFAWWGNIGVQIFFVISGFVITFSAASSSPGQFARGRFLRIWPTVLVCATLTLGAVLASDAGVRDPLGLYLNTLVLRPGGPWIDASYWTLVVEVVFYALVAAALALGRRRVLEPLILVIGGVSSLYWAARGGGVFGLWPILPLKHEWADPLLLSHGCCFAVGALLWIMLTDRPTATRLLAVAMCFCAGIVSIVWSDLPTADGHGQPVLVPVLAWSAAVGIVALFAARPAGHGFLARHASLVRFIGLMTYPLYLLHQTCGEVLLRALGEHGLGGHRFAALGLVMGAMLVAAAGVTAFIEPRARALVAAGIDRLVLSMRPAIRHGRPQRPH